MAIYRKRIDPHASRLSIFSLVLFSLIPASYAPHEHTEEMTMDFSTPERHTIIAALNLLLAADDTTKGAAALSGALAAPEKIRTLIERIEQERQR